MKKVMALVLGVALVGVGGSAGMTFAQTGTGGGTGTKKSTTTTASPTTTRTTASQKTAPTTSKNRNCPGKAGKHGKHKGLAHNPNC